MEMLQAVSAGLPTTLWLTLVALTTGMLGGVPLVLLRKCPFRGARWAATLTIDLLRGIPPIVWLFIVFFGVGNSIVQMSPFTAATLGLGAITSAYFAEIYRGSLAAVPSGQWDAASALNLSASATLLQVVGPQVVRVSLPAAMTWTIGLFKDTSIASAIGVGEMLYHAKNVSSQQSSAILPYLLAAALYVVVSVPIAYASRTHDARLRRQV